MRARAGRWRRAGATPPAGTPDAGAPPAGVPLNDLVRLLYPDVDDVDHVLAQARAILGGAATVSSLVDLRRVILGMERQLFPTPVTVQFRTQDLVRVEVDGVSLLVDPADPAVSRYFAAGEPYEPHVSAVVRRVVRPGMTVCDVGANIGYLTMLFSSLVGPTGRVLAFEPASENVRLILASVRCNGATNVEVVPLGLDAERGWAEFAAAYGSNGGFMGDGVQVSGGRIVPTTTLDEYVGDRHVDVVKIDVEGAEPRVLRGAHRTIGRDRPVLITEFSCDMLARVSHVDPAEHLDALVASGYRIFVIDRAEPGLLVPFESGGALVAAMADRYQIEDLLLVPAGREPPDRR